MKKFVVKEIHDAVEDKTNGNWGARGFGAVAGVTKALENHRTEPTKIY